MDQRNTRSNTRDWSNATADGSVVVERLDQRIHRQMAWRVRCRCGSLFIVGSNKVQKAVQRSSKLRCVACINLVIEEHRKTHLRGNSSGWKMDDATKHAISRGLTRHGQATRGRRSPTYKIWLGIIQRCTDRNAAGWLKYGARGIGVCDRWRLFENFLADMGERPDGLTIDRYPNGDGNYEPGNCRWATYREQAANSRNAVMLTFENETHPMSEWSRRVGIKVATIAQRIRHGWAVDRALTTRPNQHARHAYRIVK